MKHVSILPLYDAVMHSIDSSYQLLSRVNDFMRYQGKPPCFEIDVLGLDRQTSLSGGLYNITAGKTIGEVNSTDIIILPLLCGNFDKAIQFNEPYTAWLRQQYPAAEIVCLCTGSFYLASTGLLDGKKCSVHWAALNEFQLRFPAVKATDSCIITDENAIYTCGGNYSYLNLLLYIIEKHAGRETAVLASKMFEIDIERRSQSPFMILTVQKAHGDEEILAVQSWIEAHAAENFSVDFICKKFALGRRTFERRFKKLTGNSLVEYSQRVKVELAKRELEHGRKTVNEIIYQTGYSDVDAFRKVFKKYTSLTPLAYRKKYM